MADPLTQLVSIAILALTIFTVVISMDSDFTDHIGEFLALILLSAVGMLFLVASEDLLMVFISLELTSLSLYILTAFDKRSIRSAEAALKYFLFGGMSAAFTLFGFSLIYGLTGSTNLREIAAAIAGKGMDPAADRGACDGGDRIWIQSGGGAVSLVGAGRLPRARPRRARPSSRPGPRLPGFTFSPRC